MGTGLAARRGGVNGHRSRRAEGGMRLGMVGLGKMGGNMVQRLARGGHHVVVHDRDPEVTARIGASDGAEPAGSLDEIVAKLQAPRVIWVMVPAGGPTEQVLQDLAARVQPGDVLIDGGNSNFHDTQRRAADLAGRGVRLVDAGTSGGVWGRAEGYCLMVGGAVEHVAAAQPVFDALAPEGGFVHTGAAGTGHFTKMVHNGIEYGLMQAYAEGFELMYHSGFELDLSEIAGIWRYGSVVRSWLLELLHAAMEQHGDHLDEIAPYVEDSGEGRWTINEAINANVPVPAITSALFARFASRREIDFSAKVQAALRNQFGGHAVKAVKEARKR
ncbi:MAG TPA: decarboxylating 6-phosphogluconate dehydrogenase [Longimicrobium sp.]|nr:decarboxylating 6-phosphogluconate dehydrogenase [Longimicrobium sp.]